MSQNQQVESLSLVRPRFKVLTKQPVEDIVNALKLGLQKADSPCTGEATQHHTLIALPIAERHYWSPVLSMTMEETEEGTVLRGQYGPRPTVWTMFVFFYSTIGFSIIFIALWGLSEVALGKPSPALWLIPVLILLFLSLYLVAYLGKKKSQKQMSRLHNFIENCLNFHFEEHI